MKDSSSRDTERSKYLVQLAEVLFELAQHEEDRGWLEPLRETTLKAKGLFDKVEKELHPDLGFTLDEYLLFKLDGKKQESMTNTYAEELGRILTYIKGRH